MPFRTWVRKFSFLTPARDLKPSRYGRVRPSVEVLESRDTPAIFSAAGSDLLLSGFLSGEQMSFAKSGANQISVTLSGDTWAGVNGSPAGVSGNGNATLVINSSTFTGAIRFSDSAGSQTLNIAGNATAFGNAISVEWLTGIDSVVFGTAAFTSTAGLSIVATGAGSTVTLNQDVTTAGDQFYNSAVALGANVTVTSTSNGNITFDQALNGAFDLTVNTGGGTTFSGVVGGTAPLTNLTTDAGGLTTIGANVTTAGDQTYGDSVALVANVALTSTGAGDITLVGVDNAFTLAVNTSGATNFNGAVGGSVALAGLTTDAGGTTLFNASVNTGAGTQTYNDNVTLGQALIALTGDVTFNAGLILGATAPAATSTLQITGDLTFAGTTTVTSTFTAGPFGHITVTGGTTTFGGATLVLNYNGFVPTPGTIVTVVSGSSASGQFGNVPAPGPVNVNGTNYLVAYSGGNFVLTVPIPVPPVVPPTTAAITGTVFLDLNHNGRRDSGESGVAGRTVYLDTNANGVLDAGEVTTTTDAAGAYAFRDLPAGIYNVRPDLSVPTFVTTGVFGFSFNLNGTDQTGLDFPGVYIQPASAVQVTTTLYGSTNPDANTAYVRGLYYALLGRDADAAGLAHWTARLASGTSRAQVAQTIYTSAEHRGLQVDAYYRSFLGRSSDSVGRQGWVSAFLSGADEAAVVKGFLTSSEYQSAHADTDSFVRELYLDVLGRSASDAELAPWRAKIAAGASRAQIADQFLHSEEAVRLAVSGFYSAYLHRAADAGSDSWVIPLRNSTTTLGQVAVGILSDPSSEFFNNGRATVA
ncbi:Uncultured bacterium genome assembly Metasoil_fosmids_resub OS=uncultured bacterium PE=4 SV=1: DUF4214: DUF4214: DUF4214 [Gemmata massiliana]|uniref:DUF4214 domain-containing protein n=1 Tax=Gemmata massiliana TaxID=1210884 RepID=A0A6P2D3E9_9BACT|nr:DUF4214 domain-containing protein [Gemmata massiliana]VTR95831.1 Uncultured bacterium genome assembly Metasoil_fosmids_resub OS=uncultured bacterium PE=4 SV=1: DUF4214: DUF4214: DUF4214 [Gemmata massiliana]